MCTQNGKRYTEKAAFFDAQVRADWAADTYGPGELEKLARLFTITGPLDTLRILEPGCGTGRLTLELAARVGPRGQVVAMDISPRMVGTARERLVGCANVDILLGPVEDLVDSIGRFDQVICHQVFPHFEDQAHVLALLTGTLPPGGRFIISHFIPFAEINDIHRKAGTVVARDMMPPPNRMRELFEAAGLAIERWLDDDEGYLLSARKF